MKFRVTMKDPDGVYDSTDQAVKESVGELELPDDELEAVKEVRGETIRKAIANWFKYSEYITVEIDTDAKTCTVMPVTR